MIVEKVEKIHPCYVLCCTSDPVKIISRIKAAAFNPGQIITVEIHLNNQSAVPILQITVELIKVRDKCNALRKLKYEINVNCFHFQQIFYFKRANSESQKWESIPMIRKLAEGCDSHQEKTISVDVDIPRLLPTDSASNLLKVKYLIRVSKIH